MKGFENLPPLKNDLESFSLLRNWPVRKRLHSCSRLKTGAMVVSTTNRGLEDDKITNVVSWLPVEIRRTLNGKSAIVNHVICVTKTAWQDDSFRTAARHLAR